MSTNINSVLFQQCAQLSKLAVDEVPSFIEIYSDHGELNTLAKHAVGSYTLHGKFALNTMPIYKHNCLDLYLYYDLISNGFCVSYDQSTNNCIVIFDLYNDLDPMVWDTDKEKYIPSLQLKYRFYNEEPELHGGFNNIPKRIKLTSVGAFGQMVWDV